MKKHKLIAVFVVSLIALAACGAPAAKLAESG